MKKANFFHKLKFLKSSLAVRIWTGFFIFLFTTILSQVIMWYLLLSIVKRNQEIQFRLLESRVVSLLSEIYFDYTLQEIKIGSSPELKLLLQKETTEKLQSIMEKVGGQLVILKGEDIIAGKKHFLETSEFVRRELVFNPLGWKVYLLFPKKVVPPDLEPLLLLYFGILFFLFLLGVGLFYLVYCRSIREPIRSIIRELEGLPRGQRLSPTGIREIDLLAEEVNLAVERERALFQRLALAEKLSALGTLAGGYAHEFNNLLQAVSGHLDLAQRWIEKGDLQKAKDHLERAEKSALRGKRISDRILRLSRRELGLPKKESSDLSSVVRHIVEALRAGLPPSLRLETHLEAPLWIPLSEEQVQEILMNLFLNAREAVGEEGLIRIEARRVKDKVFLVVEDSGPGIPKEMRSRIFDPFFTTKPPGKGTGLGLFLVHQLITEAGGEIRVSERTGGGARFEILLPSAKAPSETKILPTFEPEKRPSKMRILIVDDEEGVREALREFLEFEGWKAETADSAEEALQKLRSQTFDTLLVDLYMAGKDGVWLVKRAYEEGWSGRIFFITGFAGEFSEEAQSLIKTGKVKGVLRKPFDFRTLRQILDRGGGEK